MESFFFYDLETSGINPRESRIMQFAGQRTDLDLKPIGDPINLLIKQSSDMLPEPEAVLITGITPQQTINEGISEAEFARLFNREISRPNTIFVGFNNVRFDDEFMRFLFYRNFHDAYEWQWKDGRSRWDLLDLSRMTRALRPEGIEWPFSSDGKASNRLELLTSINKIEHIDAHDALSDVNATIAIGKMIKEKQPKLFEYLLNLRNKKAVQKLVTSGEPYVYSSGKYPGDYHKTCLVMTICDHPDKNGVLVYDLKFDLKAYADKSPDELAELWKWLKDSDKERLPVKSLQFNRCPAVAPATVLNLSLMKRLGIDETIVKNNLTILKNSSRFAENLVKAVAIMNKDRITQTDMVVSSIDVDNRLYDNFISDSDRIHFKTLQSATPESLSDFIDKFTDDRLKILLPLYKARNFPNHLISEEITAWEMHCRQKLFGGNEKSRMSLYTAKLDQLRKSKDLTKEHQYLLSELKLWAESLMPST